MTLRTKPASRESARVEQDLLARLGLTIDANSQDIEAAHDELVQYLERAPHDLRQWAEREIAVADEAYALLSDPASGLATFGSPIARLTTLEAATSSVAASSAAPADVEPDAEGEYFEELDDEPPQTRRQRREAGRQGRAAAKHATAGQPRRAGAMRLVKRLAIGAAAVVGAVAIALAGYNLGSGPNVPGFTGTPAPETGAAGPKIDQAKVADLMQQIKTDPKNIAALMQLGDIFFQAGDFNVAGGWMEKALQIDPKNVQARLALGAAQFNLDNVAQAEQQWRQVLTLDPSNLEAHYDLGFMYLSKNPPDLANVRLEWSEVIRIAPDSEVAKTVATHLKSLDASPAPSAAAPASGVPASAAPSAPAASPAPSAK